VGERRGSRLGRRRIAPLRALSPREWARLPDEGLLRLRICDLDLRIEGTWLEERIERAQDELAARGLRLRPPYWLSDEWFCPHGAPGIAIPFTLAHPRLVRLERRRLGRVEGGTRPECLRILRHELGHAILYAFRLQRTRRFAEVFGRAGAPYPKSYRPDPTSRAFVRYLDHWYAQSHPLEDFAETFAVWLDPRSSWRRRYATWPAAEKLECVDAWMQELAGRTPPRHDRRPVDPIRDNRMTLGEHFRRRRAHYGDPFPAHFDAALRRTFRGTAGDPAADAILRATRREIVARANRRFPGEEYTVDLVFRELAGRAHSLGLRARRTGELRGACERLLVSSTRRRLRGIRERVAM